MLFVKIHLETKADEYLFFLRDSFFFFFLFFFLFFAVVLDTSKRMKMICYQSVLVVGFL